MTIREYISNIKKRYQTGISREHAYRGDLQQLLETMLPDTIVTNEPARIDCGSPDYVITRKDIPIGYIEAKDIGIDLGKTLKSDQLKRYMASLDNLILTDYMRFVFIKDGEVYETIDLFELSDGLFSDKTVEEQDRRYAKFEALIQDFAEFITQTIKNPTKLASMMANKAKLLAQVINRALTSDVESNANSSLKEQMEAFKLILIHDIKPSEFADIYAQTIAYGMFAARLHDPTPDTFSRQEAASLIPKSNPFLRKLFQYISGYDIDERIEWIVSALADIFRATDVAEILKDFGKATQMNDPFIHFYEYFLAEYDPKLRKARGVWYTPEPVVNFIVRAVDDVLKSEFGLPKGLADNSKAEIEVDTDIFDKKKQKYKKVKKQVHKVQILDPATGTGTFLAEVVKHIYSTKFKNMQGAWPQFVENDLIPRLNGFEILMASYAMAHLKLDLLFGETGYKATKDQRFKIYLTNSLEEANPDTGTLFANWLSSEASEANAVKRDTPVMCVIGNPPYSGESQNKGDWIMNLMDDYKKEPGGEIKLQERNPKWINDDYVKFMRYSQHFIEKNGEGVLAFINPHGFLDNPTFRGMRWNLLKTYDKIYTIDLHGNAKKKETAPDGSKDENVFDIMQGVSINIFVKTGKKKPSELGTTYHYDLYGRRNDKYQFLFDNSMSTINFTELPNVAPMYYMVSKDFALEEKYKEGFQLSKIFKTNSVGIVTSRDALVIDIEKATLANRIKDIYELDSKLAKEKYGIKEKSTWTLDLVKAKSQEFSVEYIKKVAYRPFDDRFLYSDPNFIERARTQLMECFTIENNIAIMSCRQSAIDSWEHVGITNKIVDDSRVSNRSRERGYVYPIYIKTHSDLYGETIELNLTDDFIQTFENKTSIQISINSEKSSTISSGIDFVDYCYALLHSIAYRSKYIEFLKIDFPVVPFPKTLDEYWKISRLGTLLRKWHLLEIDVPQSSIGFPLSGDNLISRKMSKNSPGFECSADDQTKGKVWINDEQYFDNVPEHAWHFYIGGYQPAQKWLKDRQGRTLTYDDIEHYQKIIAALVETDNIMKEIDEVGVV